MGKFTTATLSTPGARKHHSGLKDDFDPSSFKVLKAEIATKKLCCSFLNVFKHSTAQPQSHSGHDYLSTSAHSTSQHPERSGHNHWEQCTMCIEKNRKEKRHHETGKSYNHFFTSNNASEQYAHQHEPWLHH